MTIIEQKDHVEINSLFHTPKLQDLTSLMGNLCYVK